MKTELIAMVTAVVIFALGMLFGYLLTMAGLRRGATLVDNVLQNRAPSTEPDEFVEDAIQTNTDGTYESVD